MFGYVLASRRPRWPRWLIVLALDAAGGDPDRLPFVDLEARPFLARFVDVSVAVVVVALVVGSGWGGGYGGRVSVWSAVATLFVQPRRADHSGHCGGFVEAVKEATGRALLFVALFHRLHKPTAMAFVARSSRFIGVGSLLSVTDPQRPLGYGWWWCCGLCCCGWGDPKPIYLYSQVIFSGHLWPFASRGHFRLFRCYNVVAEGHCR